MDLGLLNYINVDMKWTITRKGRTSMTRCPRKPRADSFELGNKIHESAATERKKSGTDVAEKVVNAPSKKRRLLHQSAPPPPQTLCISGEEGLSPRSQTPSIHHENSSLQRRPKLVSKSQKTESKTRLKKTKILKPANKKVQGLDDFSGIELLAAVACGSFIHDNGERVVDFSISKELTTPPGIRSCAADIKDAESNTSIQQNPEDNGKEVEHEKVSPSKELRLHWDLNTVMDEWEEPCNDLVVEPQLPVKHDAAVSLVPLSENCNNDPGEETHELIENLEAMSTGKVNIKASDGESSASRSDVVGLLAHPVKCEDFSTSTTSVLTEQNVVNSESHRTDKSAVHVCSKTTVSRSDQQPVCEKATQGFCYNKISTDHVSECCGSNVTQEEQDQMMAEGDSEDKLQAGYDSPFEDGEFRELIDKIHKDDLGTIENPLSEKVDHGQTTDQTLLLVKEAVPNNEIKQRVQVDTSKRPHFDELRKDFCERKDEQDDGLRPVGGSLLQNKESTSFDVFRNGEYGWRNRSSATDFSIRVWDLKSHRSLDSNYSRNYDPRGVSYRTHDRRPSSSERNNGYGSSNRGPPPARSHSRDRYRFNSQEYHDPKPCYFERKAHISTNFNRHGTRPRPRSRSRSRSGSPIAWHFQKRKNLNSSNNSVEIETVNRVGHVSPERSYKYFDERRFRDGQIRDGRQASVKQRFDSVGYPERLKSDDYFRFAQRPANTRVSSDPVRKHNGYYEKVEPRRAL